MLAIYEGLKIMYVTEEQYYIIKKEKGTVIIAKFVTHALCTYDARTFQLMAHVKSPTELKCYPNN